ncbi:MAG: hypothetical protein R3311_12215 [Oceanisphaera sp.]|nr:hypothetical protein [Oceanisphaera sp.]
MVIGMTRCLFRGAHDSALALPLVSRVFAAIFAVYAFIWGVVSLGVVSLSAIGVDFHSAEQSMLMFGLLLYVALFIWVFAVKSLLRIWLVLGLGAALMLSAAWLLQPLLLCQEAAC